MALNGSKLRSKPAGEALAPEHQSRGCSQGERLADVAGAIAAALLTLTAQGGTGNFMIVCCGETCVQFLGRPGHPEVECEVAVGGDGAGKNLAEEALACWGFTAREGLQCFARTYELNGEPAAAEAARDTVLLLRTIFGMPPDARVRLKLVLE